MSEGKILENHVIEPVKKETLTEQTVRRLKQMLLSKRLKPGEEFPSERDLAESIGVSRMVVREALQTLVTEGYIEKSPGKRAKVRDFDPQLLERELSGLEAVQSKEQLQELRELRVAIELGCVPFIVQRIGTDEISRLKALVERMKDLLSQGLSVVEVDREFHDVLVHSTRNASLINLRQSLLHSLRSRLYEMPTTQNGTVAMQYHIVRTAELMVRALEKRDIDLLENVLRDHLIFTMPPEQAQVFLMVDDEDIAYSRNVARIVHPLNKFPGNPLLVPEYPWEGEAVLPSATLIYDEQEKQYRMWYHGFRFLSYLEEQYSLCYATSVDGIHWRKPALNLIPLENGPSLNLLVPWGHPQLPDVMSSTIFHNPRAEQELHKYIMIYFCSGVHPVGLGLALSEDGIHWQFFNGNPVDTNGPEPIGDVVYALKNPEQDAYEVYYRVRLRVRPRRTIARAESKDLIHWSGHQVILAPDELDPPDAELHGLTPFRYGNQLLGLLWVGSDNNTRIEVQLACSRDGIHWQRVGNRAPFLSPGPAGAFDSKIVARTTMPVVVGNELWFYYMGTSGILGRDETARGAIGLATATMDRFVSFYADQQEGEIVTRPIYLSEQTKLLINACTNPSGYILVEVLDDNGTTIAGFSREASIPFSGSAVFHQAKWQEHSDLCDLLGRRVRLRFILCKAHLFAFRLCHPAMSPADLVAGIC